jgi:hypothetical protein
MASINKVHSIIEVRLIKHTHDTEIQCNNHKIG